MSGARHRRRPARKESESPGCAGGG
jgi:hypothetical protein